MKILERIKKQSLRIILAGLVAAVVLYFIRFLHPLLVSEDKIYVTPVTSNLFLSFFVIWSAVLVIFVVPHIFQPRKSAMHPLQSIFVVIPVCIVALYLVAKIL